ncbi:hypothetical protein C2845_PM05G23520 [Panicum miliaceum]|uniref:Uncharacterized protein n=1 Tax=Panicum miliaceum TaxID=4540 RepID=A0A3L6SWW8_PANMI|nr:hypothetical protein C2845_PM05G23520 [Panicum miliaceum]
MGAGAELSSLSILGFGRMEEVEGNGMATRDHWGGDSDAPTTGSAMASKPRTLTNFRATIPGVSAHRVSRACQEDEEPSFLCVAMGKLCCSNESEEEAGFNLLGLLVAAVIALVFMLLCTPPKRRCVTIYPCC